MRSGLFLILRAILLGMVGTLSACQQPAPAPVVQGSPTVDGVGYMVFNAPIVRQTRDMFIADMDKMFAAGAKEIHLAMNSPGGDIDAAQGMVDYMARVHANQAITFKVYNIGLVASAATYVFLNAQDRFTAARSAFLFHAAGAISSGPSTAQVLRDQADKLEAYERVVRSTLKARTRLTDGETLTYVRRTVVLNADDAKRDGIVDAVAEYTVPKEARPWTISAAPRTTAPRPAPPAPVPN